MGKIVKLGLVLFVITAVTGLILGAVHTVTLEPIRRVADCFQAGIFSSISSNSDMICSA